MRLKDVEVGERYVVAIARDVIEDLPPQSSRCAVVHVIAKEPRRVRVHIETVGICPPQELLNLLGAHPPYLGMTAQPVTAQTVTLPASRLVMTADFEASTRNVIERLRERHRKARRQESQRFVEITDHLGLWKEFDVRQIGAKPTSAYYIQGPFDRLLAAAQVVFPRFPDRRTLSREPYVPLQSKLHGAAAHMIARGYSSTELVLERLTIEELDAVTGEMLKQAGMMVVYR